MTDAELRAVERIAEAAERIEQFRTETEGRKAIPASMLQNLRMARRHVQQVCNV